MVAQSQNHLHVCTVKEKIVIRVLYYFMRSYLYFQMQKSQEELEELQQTVGNLKLQNSDAEQSIKSSPETADSLKSS